MGAGTNAPDILPAPGDAGGLWCAGVPDAIMNTRLPTSVARLFSGLLNSTGAATTPSSINRLRIA